MTKSILFLVLLVAPLHAADLSGTAVPCKPGGVDACVEFVQEKTMQCKKCKKKMIKRYEDYMLTSYPAQSPWYWWCKCGHRENGGIERGTTTEELMIEQWERANK